MKPMRIREGFPGQKMWVLPKPILEQWSTHPMLQSLIPTDIGWYPDAKYHYRERENGADEHILIFCVAGTGWYEINGQEHIVRPHEAILIPRGIPHTYGADQTTPWSIHWVHFTGSQADFFLYHLPIGEQKLPVAPKSVHAIERLFRECYDSFVGGFVLYRLIYCTQILHHLLGYLFFNNDFFSPTQRTSRFRNLEATLEFLHQNIHRKITLSEMASHAGISVSHFSSLFKQQTDYSPVAYFIHLKVQRACTLLSLSQSTVQEIAYDVGYDDPYHFSRIFKKVVGVSPSQYRQSFSG